MRAAISNRLSRFMITRWDGWLLVIAMTMLVLFNLNQNRSSVDEKMIIDLGFMAFLFGLLLAESRWSGRRAAFYSIASSFLISVLKYADLVPLFSKGSGFLDWLLSTQMRWTLFGQRLAEWGRTLVAGRCY